MSRQYYDHGYTVPDYYTQHHHSPRQQRNQSSQSRIPRSGFAEPERMRGPTPMRTEYVSASHGRSPRRIADPRPPPNQQSNQHYAQSNPWQASQNLYDGSAFPDQEEYGQYDQWPLPAIPDTRSSRNNGNSPRRPPPRPLRPDEQLPARGYQQRPEQMGRALPHVPSPAQQLPPSSRSTPLHHGDGQWTNDGYVLAPPPNHPLPSRPLQPFAANSPNPPTSIPACPDPLVPEQAALAQANRRLPLGPPPSARRGPSSYYPHVVPVHPIEEETDSMRGSARTGSAYTAGHASRHSFASSSAIPIGMSPLNHGREAAPHHQPMPRPAPLSVSEHDNVDDSPTEPAVVQAEMRTPGPPDTEGPSSPGHVVVRQASLGKKRNPTLTTVKSSSSMRRGPDARTALATLASQQHGGSLQHESYDCFQSEKSALDPEMLIRETEAGAPEPPRKSDLRPSAPMHHSSEASQYVASPHARNGDCPAGIIAAANSKDAGSKQVPQQEPHKRVSQCDAHLDEPPPENSIEQGLSPTQSKDLLRTNDPSSLYAQSSHDRSPLAAAVDTCVESILGSLEKGGALSAEEADGLKRPMGGLSERSAKPRPPRLNVEAVREAEARGSLTSLSDLIRRATKLASNLDRGKTASRMGLNWVDGAPNDEKRRSGSISDILSSFPPPEPDSRNGFRKSLATWSAKNRHSALPSDSDAGERKQSQKCCGMPLWLFLALFFLLVLLIAAAVVVPVVLVVLPKQNAIGSTKVGSCTTARTCQNGGTNIMSSNGQCDCLCVNGFSGPTCSSWQEDGCTTVSTRSAENLTLGAAIPRLLEHAEANFSVPLHTQELLGLFSSLDLSCNTQNQLVTFNSQSGKRSTDHQSLPSKESVVDAESTSDTPTSIAAAPSSSGSITTNSTVLDFARVTVLYILQESSKFEAASDAQENLQAYFRIASTTSQQTATSQEIALGHGYSCSLDALTIMTSNGTCVGRPGCLNGTAS